MGVQILQAYCGIEPVESLHIGDQFLNTGNDYAARAVSPCVWITSPQETTYILKSILRLAGAPYLLDLDGDTDDNETEAPVEMGEQKSSAINFAEMERRAECVKQMDVYTGEMISTPK